MRIVLQVVARASVSVGPEVVGAIDRGLLALVGVGRDSRVEDAAWLAAKTSGLRVFPHAQDPGRMDRSVADVGGSVLAVSQFTLYGDVSRGRRPSFVSAAEPEHAQRCYAAYCDALDVPVEQGVFGAHMVIDAVATGPVTLVIERS